MEAREKTYPTGAAKWILVLTALTCALLQMIDTTIVMVALPDIGGNIGASQSEISWVVTAYVIANAIVIPLSGMLSNLFGRRAYFTGSVVLFTFCSLMCGISNSFVVLVIWRFIQGMAGGGLIATAQSIMIDAFPPEKINTANSLYGIGAIVGPIIGPILGGVLVEHFTWHWVFLVNLPLGIVAAILSWIYVNDLKVKKPKIDWWGILFLILGVGALQYILEEGQIKDWFSSSLITLFFIIGILGLGFFIWRELKTKHPAVKISLLRSYNFIMGNIINLVMSAVLFITMFIFPLFVQSALGWDAIETGLYLMYLGISCAVSMLLVRRLLDKGLSAKASLLIGVVLYALYPFLLSSSSPDSGGANFILPLILGGIGMSFLFLPIMTISLAGLKGSDLAQGTGLFNMIKQLGGGIGIALINIYLDHQNTYARAGMLSSINEYSTILQDKMEAFKALFFSNGYAVNDAQGASYGMLQKLVEAQAHLIGFNQGYLFVSIVLVLVCVPAILLIKPAKK